MRYHIVQLGGHHLCCHLEKWSRSVGGSRVTVMDHTFVTHAPTYTNSYVDILIPVIIFGGGAFGRPSGWSFQDGVSGLVRRVRE